MESLGAKEMRCICGHHKYLSALRELTVRRLAWYIIPVYKRIKRYEWIYQKPHVSPNRKQGGRVLHDVGKWPESSSSHLALGSMGIGTVLSDAHHGHRARRDNPAQCNVTVPRALRRLYHILGYYSCFS